MSLHHVHAVAHRGQKKVSDLPELELQVVVSHNVGAENRTQVLCKSSQGHFIFIPFYISSSTWYGLVQSPPFSKSLVVTTVLNVCTK